MRILRDDPATRDIPVVAVTANAMKGEPERALAASFDAYVSKSIDIEVLFGILDRILDTQPR